jgi:CRP/FNR family transcriptional regulator, cyclic AMP receptor protein
MPFRPPLDVLDRDPWFLGLPDSFKTGLLDIGKMRHYEARQRLFSRGDPPGGLWCVLTGSVVAFNEIGTDVDGVFGQFDAPYWFGDIAMFDRIGRTHSVEATQSVEVLHVPVEPLDRYLDAHPEAWRWLGLLLALKLRLCFTLLDELAGVPADARVARRLLLLATGFGMDERQLKHALEIHQEQLAQMVGMSRTSVNPILGRLSAAGMLSLSYGRIRIIDMAGLKSLAQWQQPLESRPSGG